MPFCPACGTKNDGAACLNCGTIIPASHPGASPAKGRSGEPRVAGGVIGTVVLMIVGGLWVAGRNAVSSSYANGTVDTRAQLSAAARAYSHLAEDVETGGSHCTPRDFKLSGLRGTEEYGYITIVGVVKNNCSEAAGPQLKVSIYNKKGVMLDTQEPWPASVSNIAAHDSYEFKTMMPAQDGWETYRVGVLSVKRW